MFEATLRLTRKNESTGKLSVSRELAKAYFNGQISGLIVLNEDRSIVIERYDSKELATLMGSMDPFMCPDKGRVKFWLAKRK